MEEIIMKEYLQDKQRELQTSLDKIQKELKLVEQLLAIQEYNDSFISYRSEK